MSELLKRALNLPNFGISSFGIPVFGIPSFLTRYSFLTFEGLGVNLSTLFSSAWEHDFRPSVYQEMQCSSV